MRPTPLSVKSDILMTRALGLAAAAGQPGGVVLDGVVQQGGADHVRVPDVIVADDPDGDPQQVIDVRLALAPVTGVQPGRQCQCLPGPLPVTGREAGDLYRETFPQPGLATARG